jgi:sugar phosphate isomerase/epimerase
MQYEIHADRKSDTQQEIPMHFAVSLWNLAPSPEAIAALQADGVTAAEFGPPFLLQEDESAFRATVARYHAAGIRFYASHAPFDAPAELSQLDEDGRRSAVEIHLRALSRAALADVSCLVIHPGRGNCPEDEIPLRSERLTASLETLVPAAERAGVRLALENMLPVHVGTLSADVRAFVDHFDSFYLGICLDTGHAHVTDAQGFAEGAPAAFVALRDQIIAFHLADNSGAKDHHLQPPYGSIDWETLAPAILAAGYDFPATVETPPWNESTPRQLLREMQALFGGQWTTYEHAGHTAHARCAACQHYLFGPPEAPWCACDQT